MITRIIGPVEEGLSLRDYFAMHAPVEKQSWFEPVMPPRPEPEYSHDHPREARCRRVGDCVPENDEALQAYDHDVRRQYDLQWPYAWADAMLKERAKSR